MVINRDGKRNREKTETEKKLLEPKFDNAERKTREKKNTTFMVIVRKCRRKIMMERWKIYRAHKKTSKILYNPCSLNCTLPQKNYTRWKRISKNPWLFQIHPIQMSKCFGRENEIKVFVRKLGPNFSSKNLFYSKKILHYLLRAFRKSIFPFPKFPDQ